MNDELKQLIEDAAKLLGYSPFVIHDNCIYSSLSGKLMFNPLDPERGDLRKVAEAAGLAVDYDQCRIAIPFRFRGPVWSFIKGDYQSQAYAVLHAASAVLKERNKNV